MTSSNETTRSVRRWEPFGDLDFSGPSLFRRMLGDVWENAPRLTRPDMTMPAMDIVENEKAYVVTAELPGCKPEDVTVELHEGVLAIRGEKKSERSEEKEHSRWTERSFGSFHRSFRLPADAAQSQVDASFKDGVLTIGIAKTEESKPQVVRIKS
jgi:HSP20 family protein